MTRNVRLSGQFHRVVATVLAVIGLAIAGVAPASATPLLLSANPAADERVSALPEMYRLEFDEPMNPLDSEINVYDPTGFSLNESPLTTEAGGTILGMISHYTDRPYGTYVVAWDVASMTGSRTAGSFSFIYAAPEPSASSEPAPEPSVVTPTPSATMSPTPTPSETMDPEVIAYGMPSDSGGDVGLIVTVIGWTALGLGLLSGLAILILTLIRRRAPKPSPPPQPSAPTAPPEGPTTPQA